MKRKLLIRANIILAALIAFLGVGCKSHKAIQPKDNEEAPPPPPEVITPDNGDVEILDPPVCLYGPPPMIMVDTVSKAEVTEPIDSDGNIIIMVKYGVPPVRK